MNFEEAGRAIDQEVAKVLKFLDRKVKTSGRRDMAEMLRKAAQRFSDLADSLDKPSGRRRGTASKG